MYKRQIVSNIAGTTRDTIEELLHIKGNAFRLIDTAGLRETTDEIEKIGVKKAIEKVEQAEILIYLIDSATNDFTEDLLMIKPLLREDLKLIICATKIDEVIPSQHEKMEALLRQEIAQAVSYTHLDVYKRQALQLSRIIY